MAGPDTPRVLTLEDPRAIRALAHEARQRVIDELYSGEVLTATEAARICGLTPSAMSYHLRALEKWGIVVQDGSATDGRTRPWRAAAEQLHVGPSLQVANGPVAAGDLFSTSLTAIHRAVEAWAALPDGQRGPAHLSRGRLWLSDADATALNHEIDALIQRYDTRTSRDHSAGAAARDFLWVNVPHS